MTRAKSIEHRAKSIETGEGRQKENKNGKDLKET
jgi:hypothetical protein